LDADPSIYFAFANERIWRLENQESETANEPEQSLRDSADATSLFKVSQQLPQQVKEM
jgi:hypothetical protein